MNLHGLSAWLHSQYRVQQKSSKLHAVESLSSQLLFKEVESNKTQTNCSQDQENSSECQLWIARKQVGIKDALFQIGEGERW